MGRTQTKILSHLVGFFLLTLGFIYKLDILLYAGTAVLLVYWGDYIIKRIKK